MPAQRRNQPRSCAAVPGVGPRRAAVAGLLLGAALWNLATLWQVVGLIVGPAAAPKRSSSGEGGCTSLLLDRPSGRTVAWPCPQPSAWLESALPAARVASTVGH